MLPLFANLSPCLVGLEACATAHYWARELALLGHEVRLYIRRLLVLGATALIRYARARSAAEYPWLGQLLERRPARLASVAAANKMARVAWALLARNEVYSTAPTATAT